MAIVLFAVAILIICVVIAFSYAMYRMYRLNQHNNNRHPILQEQRQEREHSYALLV